MALSTLAKFQKQGVEPIAEACGHGDPHTRSVAAESIGGPEASAALPALARLLDDPDLDVCARAAESLGRMGPDAIPYLEISLDRGGAFTRDWAREALMRIHESSRQH